MKKKITLQKATVAAGVVAMSVGLFNSFTAEGQSGSSGSGAHFKCCERTYFTCYHPDGHLTFADSDEWWEPGECPTDHFYV